MDPMSLSFSFTSATLTNDFEWICHKLQISLLYDLTGLTGWNQEWLTFDLCVFNCYGHIIYVGNWLWLLPGVYAGLITKIDPTTTTTTTTTTTSTTGPVQFTAALLIELQTWCLHQSDLLRQPHHVHPPKNFKWPPKILFLDIFGENVDGEALGLIKHNKRLFSWTV